MPLDPTSPVRGVDGDAVVDAAVSVRNGPQAFAHAKAVFLVNPQTGQPAGASSDASAANQSAQIALETAIRDRLPAALGPQAASASLSVVAAPTDGIGNGTREYAFGQATRTAIGATSSAAVAIGTLGTSREVMLVASSRCMIKWGTSGVTAAAATDTDVLVLPADAMFHLRVPAGVTHFRVIRDAADGFLRVTPVA